MQGILHIVHTLWTCARISFNFLRKTYTFCMEGLCIFHGTAAHILWKNYTFCTETLPIFYRTVIHFVRKGCIFSTENPVHIIFYGSVMHLLRNSYTFSKEVLHIFYGTRVSLTGHRSLRPFSFLRNQNTSTVSESIQRHRYASCDWLDTLHSIQIPH